MKTKKTILVQIALGYIVLLGYVPEAWSGVSCPLPTSIKSEFNGTLIHQNHYIWFNSVLKPTGVGSTPVTISFTGQMITSSAFSLPVPDATVTFDPNVSVATTTFTGGMWVTQAPASGLAGNTFLSGLSYLVPANIPGGLKNVVWSGNVSYDRTRRDHQMAMGRGRLHDL